MNNQELVTLQFGNYSNHVGAHFWNIQELSFDYTGKKCSDINHDVLYRASGKNVTYTPRLLLCELKDGLGSLSPSGGLVHQYDQSEITNNSEWSNIETKQEPVIEKNDYLKYINNELEDVDVVNDFDFEKNTKTWTDYLFPRFHSRTISSINDYKYQDEQNSFEIHHMGLNKWSTEQFSEVFTDNIRKYVEECDHLQGFQILLDAADGFGGLASGCLQYLCDEYPTKSKFHIPLLQSYFKDNEITDEKQRDISILRDSTRLINTILTFDSLFENSSLFIPMCCGEKGWRKPGNPRQFHNLYYDSKLQYHTSAIMATAIDTISLGYRQKGSIASLSDICADMTGYGRKMAAASLGLPFHMAEHVDLIDHLDKLSHPMLTDITPNCSVPTEKLFQHITVRGIPESRLKRPLKLADKQIKMPAYKCETVKEMIEFYYQCNHYASATLVVTSPHGLETKMPFPKFFDKNLNSNGFVKEFESDDRNVESVPVIAGVHNGTFISNCLDNLCSEAKRIKIGKLHKFREEGLEADDYMECLNKICDNQNNYVDEFEL